jgi:ferredoxin-NADP reductase
MKVSVRGHLFDLLAFRGLVGQRKKRFAKASAEPVPVHAVNQLAAQLHPDKLNLVVTQIKNETGSTKTFRLQPDPASATKSLPYFRAGQYLSLKVDVAGCKITRPYSLSSAPFESLGEGGFYEITIKKTQDGFLTGHIWQQWQVGTPVESAAPGGLFYYEPLRDQPEIVGLAGGSGITPFRSIAREIVHGGLEASMHLLYGSSAEDDIVFYEEFKELEKQAAGRVRVVNVLSCESVSLPGCEQGFITAEIMRKYADIADSSFFICGPQVMYRFVEGEIAKLNLPRKRVRWETFGEVKSIASYPGFPTEKADATFRLKVQIGAAINEIPAKGGETILVAMERANLAPPSQCRSGECGYCRSRLVNGEVFVVPDSDARRAADRQFGYIHPCASYPLSDLEVQVPRNG